MRVVIAGGGLAAQRCAEALRRRGHDGPLTMVCAEEQAPYDRPPLSKELLAGEREAHDLRFRDDDWYRDQDVELLLGTRATAVDAAGRTLQTTAGAVGYDRLLIATGARARRLPFLDGYENVHVLRDLADAQGLAAALTPGARLVVVGAGFVGLEVASTAAARGVEVTVLEAAPTPLAAILGESLGRWFGGHHRRNGVEVVAGADIARIHGDRRVTGFVLADGRRFAADVVLVAVGAAPENEWCADALDAPGVFAAGDVAGHQHWDAAVQGGRQAALAILGEPPAEVPAPYFWSDQHGVRIQLAGTPGPGTRIALEGDPEAADFEATWYRGPQPIAVLLVGRPHRLAEARRLVAGRASTTTPERNAA